MAKVNQKVTEEAVGLLMVLPGPLVALKRQEAVAVVVAHLVQEATLEADLKSNSWLLLDFLFRYHLLFFLRCGVQCASKKPYGGMPEWLKGTGCKPVAFALHRFESYSHQFLYFFCQRLRE